MFVNFSVKKINICQAHTYISTINTPTKHREKLYKLNLNVEICKILIYNGILWVSYSLNVLQPKQEIKQANGPLVFAPSCFSGFYNRPRCTQAILVHGSWKTEKGLIAKITFGDKATLKTRHWSLELRAIFPVTLLSTIAIHIKFHQKPVCLWVFIASWDICHSIKENHQLSSEDNTLLNITVMILVKEKSFHAEYEKIEDQEQGGWAQSE